MTQKPGSAARSTIGNLLTKVAVYPLAFAASVLVARTLGPADRGLYAFVAQLGGFLIPLSALGFPAGATYLVSSGKYRPADAAASCLFVGLAQGAASAVLVAVLWRLDALGQAGRDVPRSLMLPILLLMPVQGANLAVSRLLVGASAFGTANLVTLASALLSPVLMVALVVGARMGLAGAVTAFVAAQALTTAWLVAMVWSRFRPTLRASGAFVREASAYGIKAWIGEAALRANVRLDQLVLGVTAPPEALGNYAVAVTLSELLWYGPDALGPVLFNRVAALPDEASRAALVERIHRVLLLLLVPAAVALGAAALVFVPLLYGASYEATPPLLLVLLPGTVAAVTMKVLNKYFGGSGMAGRSGTTALVGSVVGMVLYVAMIPVWGAMGAAIASTIGYATMGVAALWLYRRVRTGEPRLFVPTKGDLAWATAGLRGALGRRAAREEPAA